MNHASTFDNLAASAANGIQVQQNLSTVGATGVAGNLFLDGDADGTAAAGATANNIVFSPNVSLTATGPVGSAEITLQAKTGGMTDPGALTLAAQSGVTINSNLTTGTGGPGAPLTINADTDANQTGTFFVSTIGLRRRSEFHEQSAGHHGGRCRSVDGSHGPGDAHFRHSHDAPAHVRGERDLIGIGAAASARIFRSPMPRSATSSTRRESSRSATWPIRATCTPR